MDEKLHLLKYFPSPVATAGNRPLDGKVSPTAAASASSSVATAYIYSYDESVWSDSTPAREVLRRFASLQKAGSWGVVLLITSVAELEVIADAGIAKEILEGVDGLALDQTLCSSSFDQSFTVFEQVRNSHPALLWFIPCHFAERFSGTTTKTGNPIIRIWAPQSARDLSPQASADILSAPIVLSSREFVRMNMPGTADEIALLLHLGVSRLKQYEAAGWDEAIPISVYFELSSRSDIFYQVAKMRTLNILWNLIIQELGLRSNAVHTSLAAHCSGSNTESEPHKALLGCICESLGAIIGGATHVFISGSDCSSPEATIRSLRLARNIQLIARHESKIGDVIDPVGGSWYAEHLTKSLMESSWEVFQNLQREQAR